MSEGACKLNTMERDVEVGMEQEMGGRSSRGQQRCLRCGRGECLVEPIEE